MSIGEIYLNQIYKVNTPSGTGKNRRAEATKITNDVKKDDFEISDIGRDLINSRKALKETPDVRQDLVNDLKAKFKSGKYQVNTSAIADKLLSDI